MTIIYDIRATNEAVTGSRGGIVPQMRAKCRGKGGEIELVLVRSATEVLLDARMGVQRTTALLESERERLDTMLRDIRLAGTHRCRY